MRLFKRNKKSKEEKMNDRFEVEYYPYKRSYFAKYRGKYLHRDAQTGIIELEDDLILASRRFSKQDIKELIETFKEQRFKKGVINYSYKDI